MLKSCELWPQWETLPRTLRWGGLWEDTQATIHMHKDTPHIKLHQKDKQKSKNKFETEASSEGLWATLFSCPLFHMFSDIIMSIVLSRPLLFPPVITPHCLFARLSNVNTTLFYTGHLKCFLSQEFSVLLHAPLLPHCPLWTPRPFNTPPMFRHPLVFPAM